MKVTYTYILYEIQNWFGAEIHVNYRDVLEDGEYSYTEVVSITSPFEPITTAEKEAFRKLFIQKRYRKLTGTEEEKSEEN